MVPMILGFDPRYQFVHSDDVVHALEHAAFNELPGAFNVAADGVLALSEVIGLLGKRPLPVLPPWGTGLLAAPLRRLGIRIPEEMLAQMRFGRGLDNRRFKATGFKYSYTSREAVLKLGEHQRLQPGPGRDQGALPLRARGRGVPALEPPRAPRRLSQGGRQGGRGDVRSLASGRGRLSPHRRLHRPLPAGTAVGLPKLSGGIGREALQLGKPRTHGTQDTDRDHRRRPPPGRRSGRCVRLRQLAQGPDRRRGHGRRRRRRRARSRRGDGAPASPAGRAA